MSSNGRAEQWPSSPASTGGQCGGVFVGALAPIDVSHGHDPGVAVGVYVAVHGDVATVPLRAESDNRQARCNNEVPQSVEGARKQTTKRLFSKLVSYRNSGKLWLFGCHKDAIL